jgi:anti-anti-sigma factor
MKRHRTAAKVGLATRDRRDVAGVAPERRNAVPAAALGAPAHPRPRLTLADASVRTHTLVPTGRLDGHSAPVLEAEMERLFDSGISRLVLDLRELTDVDATGLAVLAFRCRLCKRRGFDLALIPGSRLMQRAFEELGVNELLPAPDEQITAARLRGGAEEHGPDEVHSESGSRAG